MPRPRLLAALALATATVLAAGCGSDPSAARTSDGGGQTEPTAMTSSQGEPRTASTLPWEQLDLEGDLVDVDVVDPSSCTADRCPLGIVHLSGAAVPSGSGAQRPVGDVRIEITGSTAIFTCGPGDGREQIPFDALPDVRASVLGEMPTAVWADGRVDPAALDGDELVAALQIVTGSCG